MSRTFVEAKKIRGVNDSATAYSKEFRDVRKSIHKFLEDGAKTIPQIAEALKIPADQITYFLMTCRKYGQIETTGIDDMDEYYLYGLKKEKNDGED
jgi:hypothetical protein